MRIYKHGGEIRKPTFDKPKVYQRTRMFPGLEVTRSFGDLLGHHIGVSSEPDVIVHDIKGEDLFMTIATESVWDTLKPEDISEILTENGTEVSCDKINKRL
jgi:serine/threonine protein phosphatase PrpC